MGKATRSATEGDGLGARGYWIAVGLLTVLFVTILSRDIARPFEGLHAWHDAASMWRARALARYPLSYTKGVAVWAVGDPPTENPNRSLNHPQLGHILLALQVAVTGDAEWSLRANRVVLAVLGLLALMRLLRHLLDERTALLAGLIFVLLPVNGYFSGGWALPLGFSAVWYYLVLIGGLRDGPQPRPRHLWIMGAALFLIIQTGWGGMWFPMAIGIHYVLHCICRRRRPQWKLLAMLVAAPLLSVMIVFTIMLAGLGWDPNKIISLYKWRASKGERAEFTWGAWLKQFWQYALSNFTWPVLLATGAYLVAAPFRMLSGGGKNGERGRPAYLPGKGIFLMVGLLPLLILRGALWQHQYWERPLAPFIAVTAAGAIIMLWRHLRQQGRLAADVVLVAVLAVTTVLCVVGTNHYFHIRWQHPKKIAMFKMLNREIPPDKALLSFDRFITDQHPVKGAHYRPEVAYYLDREIVHARSKETRDRIDRDLLDAYVAAVQSARARRSSRRQFQIGLIDRVRAIMARDLPILLEEIDAKRRTRKYPYYLVPGAYRHPGYGILLAALNAELQKRYATKLFVPAQPAERDEKGTTLRFGMTSYYVYDLRRRPTRP